MRPFVLIALLAFGVFAADTARAATFDMETPVSAADAPAAASDLPACDSKTAIDNVKDTIDNGASKNLANVQVLDYDNLTEVSYTAKEAIRVCIGDFVLNTGGQTIAYTFWHAKSDASKILVQVQALNAIDAYQLRTMAETHNETPEQTALEAAPAPACDSPEVRSSLSRMTAQDLNLQAGVNHLQYQLGWLGKDRQFELGSKYREDSFDARNNQRECAVSINLCFQLAAGEKCGSTEAYFFVRKLGQEIIVHYSPRTDLVFKP